MLSFLEELLGEPGDVLALELEPVATDLLAEHHHVVDLAPAARLEPCDQFLPIPATALGVPELVRLTAHDGD